MDDEDDKRDEQAIKEMRWRRASGAIFVTVALVLLLGVFVFGLA